jgi:hypothetical protein
MRKVLRSLLVAIFAVSWALGAAGLARADISNSTGTNVQSGSNRSTANQNSGGKSGDAVGGQVTGVVSSGRTSVDARNTSSNSDVTSGEVRGSNTASTFTGQNFSGGPVDVGAADVTDSFGVNLQDGDNRSTNTQTVSANSGDGVAGEVIGAVTAAGGSSSIVGANRSDNVSVETGDARGDNDFGAFTGQNFADVAGPGTAPVTITDITGGCASGVGPNPISTSCANVQDGNNRQTANQNAIASTGDGVAGQVIGAVSAGATSIDANNTSTNSDVTTGDSRSTNDGGSFVGQNDNAFTDVGGPTTISDITGITDTANLQDGDNTGTLNQTAASKSGDGVGGEVIGAVTSAGGSASIVAANRTDDSDITSGDATSDNASASFVGLDRTGSLTVTPADIIDSCGAGCENTQDGSNRLTTTQSANATTGDGVGGQVLGVVSAGATSLDASNTTVDSDATTGDSHATNDAANFVGLNDTEVTGTVVGTDISGVAASENLLDGSNRRTENQTANATSGDAVAGQVSGVVTSAGGTASVVLANTSNTIDSTTGDSHFDNADSGFVGLNEGEGPLTVF